MDILEEEMRERKIKAERYQHAKQFERINTDDPHEVKFISSLKISDGMKTNFYWVAAIHAWEHNSPEPLSRLIAKHAIPADLREVIADMIQRGKGRYKKLKDSEDRFLRIAFLRDVSQYHEDVWESLRTEREGYSGEMEIVELRNQLRASKKANKELMAKGGHEHQISTRAQEDEIKYFNNIIDLYPRLNLDWKLTSIGK